MRPRLICIALVVFLAKGLLAQEETGAAAAPLVDYRKLALEYIDSLRIGAGFECRCEVVAPDAGPTGNDPRMARRVTFMGAANESGERWKKLQILRTENNETLLSTSRLAPGVAVYDNGETRLVQTLFGDEQIAYRSVAGDLLSLLQPEILGAAVANAKIKGEINESSGKTRIVARIDKPTFIKPIKAVDSANTTVWRTNGPSPKVLWLEVGNDLRPAAQAGVPPVSHPAQRRSAGDDARRHRRRRDSPGLAECRRASRLRRSRRRGRGSRRVRGRAEERSQEEEEARRIPR